MAQEVAPYGWRNAARQRVSLYLLSLLSLATQSRYEKAWTEFLGWCGAVGLVFALLSEDEQDLALADWVLAMKEEGEEGALQRARDCVAASQKHFPQRKGSRFGSFAAGNAFPLLLPVMGSALGACGRLERISRSERASHCGKCLSGPRSRRSGGISRSDKPRSRCGNCFRAVVLLCRPHVQHAERMQNARSACRKNVLRRIPRVIRRGDI